MVGGVYPGAHDPARVALKMATSGATTTFGELHARASQLARLFRDECGLQPGDHLALCLENGPHYLEVLWGALYAGLMYTACSSRLTEDELAYVVDDCGARVLILSARYADRGALTAPGVERRFSLGGDIAGYEPLADAAARHDDSSWPGDVIAGRDMLYSSGTTGRPKGIRPKELTARIDEPTVLTPVLQGLLGLREGSVYLSPAPMYHAAPLRFCMGVQGLGGTVVMMERFDAAQMLELIERERVTHIQLVPTMFVRLLRLPEDVRAAADVSSLQAVVHAAAPCPPAVKQQMIEWWGPLVHEYYASTEGVGLTWVTAQDWLTHPGTVGRAVVGVPHIVDDAGRELPAGEDGFVYFSDGPEFEYHRDSKKTAAAFDARGWATFGDIGHLDEEGYLFLTDRASYTIITGGVNVYPQETEDTLISHPKVADAAVFGIPNEEFGEEVKAVVQPLEMPDDAAALEAELIAYCRSALADVKCPRSIDFRAELPRHETGKLYKRLLKDEYAQR